MIATRMAVGWLWTGVWLCFCGGLSFAQAANAGAPTPVLTATAHSMAERAVQIALESRRSGDTLSWNATGGSFGSVTPLRTWRSVTGHYCRAYRAVVFVDSRREQTFVAAACRGADGLWRAVAM